MRWCWDGICELLTVAFHVDDLFRTGSSNSVDCRLVQLNNELGGHGVVLIVGVPDHPAVVLVLRSHGLPPFLEATRVCDDLLVVSPVVVGLDHRVGSFARNVVDLLSEIAQVAWVWRAGQAVGDQAFHVEVDPEGVETSRDERIIRRQGRPDVLSSVASREYAITELRAALVYTNPLHLAGTLGEFARSRENEAHRTRRSEKREKLHDVRASIRKIEGVIA
jgi:hypothetical protein